MPVGPSLCVIDGPPWASDAARALLRRVAAKAGVRRRFAPHQLWQAHAVELAHEAVPPNVIQRQLGHTSHANRLPCRTRNRRKPALPTSDPLVVHFGSRKQDGADAYSPAEARVRVSRLTPRNRATMRLALQQSQRRDEDVRADRSPSRRFAQRTATNQSRAAGGSALGCVLPRRPGALGHRTTTAGDTTLGGRRRIRRRGSRCRMRDRRERPSRCLSGAARLGS
jgi:Phage integrase family